MTTPAAVLAAVPVVLVSFIVLHLSPSKRHGQSFPGTPQVSGSVRGERDARKDVASGHYVLFEYGLPVPWYSEFDQCLQGYGIGVRWGEDFFINGRDPLTGLELSYYQSYDAISGAAIEKKFGSHLFDRCRDTSRKKWETRHPESEPK